MNVPFFDYPELYKRDREDFIRIFDEVCSKGAYIMQKELQDFEEEIASYCNINYAIGVGNATDALEMAFYLTGIDKGDEVILPSHTMTATPSSAHLHGGVPIFVDVDEEGFMNVDLIEEKITEKTKYIVPVQLNGRTSKMENILRISEKYNIKIIEDSAQGLGSKYKNKQAGTFGVAGVFSFYPAKVLGTLGDGGMLITNDSNLAEKAKYYRDHGRNGLECEIWGRNSRLDNIHAAFLSFQFKSFEKKIKTRKNIANMYYEELEKISEIKLPSKDDKDHYNTYQNFEITCERRDDLKSFLNKNSVGTIIQWGGKAVHQFENLFDTKISLSSTEKYFERCLMLPMNDMLSEMQVEYVINKIKEFYKR